MDVLETKGQSIDQKANDYKAYGEKKVKKRQKELNNVEKDLQNAKHYRDNPDQFDQEVKDELNQALLRMAENKTLDEIKIEEMEKSL